MNVKMSNTVVSLGALLRRCHQCVHCYPRQQSWRTLATRASEDLPRITTPHKMQTHLRKLMQRQQTQAIVKKQSFKSPVVILCKRNNFNHHRGQTYSDFGPQTLASYGWKNRKSAGDFFTVLCHDKNPALLSKGADNSFDDLHLDRDIVRAVEALGFSVPTSIQMSAIPAILRGGSTLCAAETGSGKTLAYLLPALNMLLQRRESTALVEESVNTPSIIILTPTRELADQVMGVAERLQQYLHFTVYSVCGGRGTKARLAWPVKRPMDIIISTPGVLRKLLIAGQIRSSALQQIILDEADTLLDDSFVDTVDRILHRLKIPTMSVPGDAEAGMISPGHEPANSQSGFVGGVQFVLVSATMPRGLEQTLGAYVPVESLEKVTGLGLHRLMPHVPQKFLRLLPSQKSEELVKLVRQTTAQTAGSVMVFCNSSSTSFYLGHILEENGVQPAVINGEMTEKFRRGVFERFQDGHHNILVATDIASRGLDTINVCHVVNYDFPSFVSDYIHRAGRVGRVGSSHSGRVTSFVAHKWEVEVLWQIEIAARKSADIYNVNANIKRKLLSEYAKRHGMSPDEL